MKKIILAAILAVLPLAAFGAQLQRYEPGFRTIDGSQLNQMVDALNSGLTCVSYYFTGTFAITDTTFFIATRNMRVASISEIHSVAAGGASTLQVTKDTSTNAPGAGTDLLSTAFNLNATANTVQHGTLVGTAGVVNLSRGDRLAVDFADAAQSSAGVTVTACLAPN